MVNEREHAVVATAGGGSIPVWTTEAGEGIRPGLLLIPAIFGVDEGTKTLARDLATVGAHVWVVDPFWRTSPGVIARDKEGFSEGIERARSVDLEQATLDFADLVGAMGQQKDCNGKIVALGLCWAGKFALLLSSKGYTAGGASFHGPGMANLAGLAGKIHVPLSLHFGDQDVAIPVDDVKVLRQAFEGRDNVEIFLHEGGVKHGFGDPGSDGFNRPVYEKALSAVQALVVRLR